MQRVINIDSQVLTSIQYCLRSASYHFIQNIGSMDKEEEFERGDLIHVMMEVYNGLTYNCWDQNGASYKEFSPILDTKRDTVMQSCVKAARFKSIKTGLNSDDIEECIFQFNEYRQYYRNDPWITLACEEVGSKVMFEDEDLKIIYSFKIDRIAQNKDIIVPWDYKTSKRRQNPSSLNNQFMGYAWGIDKSRCVVDKIGFQKTLPPNERFQRDVLNYDKARLDEWVTNSIWWIKLWDKQVNENYYPQNFTSCNKFKGCKYAGICERDPDSRDFIILRDYKIKEPWDVAQVLEEI